MLVADERVAAGEALAPALLDELAGAQAAGELAVGVLEDAARGVLLHRLGGALLRQVVLHLRPDRRLLPMREAQRRAEHDALPEAAVAVAR